MPKSEAQRLSQQKYQRSKPQAMIDCKQRYRDKKVENYKEYSKKSSAKYYMLTKNYKQIETTMGDCLYQLFEC